MTLFLIWLAVSVLLGPIVGRIIANGDRLWDED
jgi:hypothetical protein